MDKINIHIIPYIGPELTRTSFSITTGGYNNMLIDLYNSIADDLNAKISLVDVGLYHRWANNIQTHPSMKEAVSNMMKEPNRLEFISHSWTSFDLD